MPTRYTHGHTEPVLRSHRWRTAENSAPHLLPHLQPGTRLLDIGSGPGTITADLAERVGPATTTALEHTDEAISLTRAELERRGLSGVTCLVGDVHRLDLPDRTYDVVHAHQVLQHVDGPVVALREMLRVTADDGLVAVRDSDYSAFTWYPEAPLLEEWLDLYLRVARANGGEPDAGRRLHAWAREAGAGSVEASTGTWLYTGDEAVWWGDLWADRVVEGRFADDAQRLGASAADLARIAEGWRVWAASPDAWFTLLHGEVLARP
ncbi:class I SAM-dependent methyltransferase [Nocardioides sp. GXQ0305]|uniref:class I SAM-dependent methyltransferase n=1 Tax=Nocardioides sp. GXQ0305 TaxID=3423912 RepID=UPI003D7D8A88